MPTTHFVTLKEEEVVGECRFIVGLEVLLIKETNIMSVCKIIDK